MALEEFIIDLCEESVNGALLVGIEPDHILRMHGTDRGLRLSGYSRHTCMTLLHNLPRTPFEPVEGYTTRYSASCLVERSLYEESGYKRMCFL